MAQAAVTPRGSVDLVAYLFSFEGRILRWQYWVGQLTLAAISLAVDRMFGERSLVAMLVFIVLLWPSLAIAAKRWHDRGKSGWWSLILLVPIVGLLWVLIELGFFRGDPQANDYGDPPA